MAEPVADKPAWDPFRIPKLRTSMHLLLMRTNGKVDRVEVMELRDSVKLIIDLDNDNIGNQSVCLSLPEASTLSDMLNRMRRKVAERAEWKP